MIPVFDRDGDVLGMYGRKITANLREGTPLHLYLPGPHRACGTKRRCEASKEIILCESLIDALTFWCAGFRNVTASYGVNGFTDDHRAAFRKHGVQQVWIAYDRDEAGDAAAERLKEELLELGIGSHRVLFPKGMDANEYALKVTPAAQSLAVLLNSAEWCEKAAPAAKENSGPPPDPEPALSRRSEVSRRRRDRDRARRPPLPRPRAREESQPRADEGQCARCRGRTSSMSIRSISQPARQRAAFIKQAAEELGVKEDMIRKDVGRVLLKLEELQDEADPQSAGTREAGNPDRAKKSAREALALLTATRICSTASSDDFDRCGMVGEETNKLVGYLAAVSRHLESPLAVVVQSIIGRRQELRSWMRCWPSFRKKSASSSRR